MNTEQPVTIVEIVGHKIWCESDILGDRHVMIQHDMDGEKPFCYATFHYNWKHTSNSGTRASAEYMARVLGATGEIEWRYRQLENEMKPSNLTTPRTQEDGIWIHSHDPIECHKANGHGMWPAISAGLAILAVAGILIAYWLK